MTLFLAHAHILSTSIRCCRSLSRLQCRSRSFTSSSSSQLLATWKRVHHRNLLVLNCAVALENGGLDDAGDGAGLLSPVPLKNSGASTMANSSTSESKEELWISPTESRIERVWRSFYWSQLLMNLCGSALDVN